jgi:hypothetical protein
MSINGGLSFFIVALQRVPARIGHAPGRKWPRRLPGKRSGQLHLEERKIVLEFLDAMHLAHAPHDALD